MKHLDLFSGIGGFALAVNEVWPESKHVFCEIDPFCQLLLKKRFRGSIIHGDIRRLTADHGDECDILTGGFPCQPFSQIGQRRGINDDRHLWPEMLRIIREFQPTWVVAENVRGILSIEQGMVFEQVCLDLENEGYFVQPIVIPACAVNAPHRRDRVWFIAHKRSAGFQEARPELETTGVRREDSDASDTDSKQAHPSESRGFYSKLSRAPWGIPWLEVATELCGVDDGLPTRVDGFKLSKPRHRAAQLKALGNAIVPQVAVEIMKAIKKSNNTFLKNL